MYEKVSVSEVSGESSGRSSDRESRERQFLRNFTVRVEKAKRGEDCARLLGLRFHILKTSRPSRQEGLGMGSCLDPTIISSMIPVVQTA